MLNSPVQTLVIDSLDAISVLLDSRQRKAFLPFVNQEMSVSQAALEAGELPNTMLARVKRWQKLGLLLQTRQVPHSKGKMFLYTASANAFFVPHTATSAADLLELAQQLYAPMLLDFLESYVQAGQRLSGLWGVRFQRLQSQWLVRPAKSEFDQCEPTDADAPVAFVEYTKLNLSESQARVLQQELLGVLGKYKQLESGGKTYQVLLGLT